MVDYVTLRKDLYEKFHDAFEKLYMSELKDQLNNKQAEIDGLNMIIRDLERRLEHAEWLVDKYREEDGTSD